MPPSRLLGVGSRAPRPGRPLTAMTTAGHRILAIPQWSPARPTWSWEWLLVTVILIIWSATVLVDFRIALSILMAIGFGAAVIGLRYPRLGLLGIGMLCTLNEVAGLLVLGGGWFRWNTVSYWLLFVAMVFSPSLLSLSRWQGRLLVALILMLGLEILLSPDMLDGVQH